MKHTTFSWESIRDDIPRPKDSPIFQIIEYVLASGLAPHLFPATMHANLRIGRSSNFHRANGELTIAYDCSSGQVTFTYYDSVDPIPKPWEKTVAAADAVSTFKHILARRLRWVKFADGAQDKSRE